MNEDALYRLAYSASYRARILEAEAVIQHAVELHHGRDRGMKVAVACSGGKDSTAMLHLVSRFVPDCWVLWNDSGLELPESLPTIRAVMKHCGIPDYKLIVARGDALESMKRLRADARTDMSVQNESVTAPTRKAIAENMISLEFVGIRAQESPERKLMFKKHGTTFFNKRYGVWACYPLARWRIGDVFAYHDEHSIPLHPAYSRSPTGRESVRVSWIYERDFQWKGSITLLKRDYPEEFRKLCEIFPLLRRQA